MREGTTLQVSSRPKISKGQSHLPRPLEVPACRVPDVLVLKSTDEDFGLPAAYFGKLSAPCAHIHLLFSQPGPARCIHEDWQPSMHIRGGACSKAYKHISISKLLVVDKPILMRT